MPPSAIHRSLVCLSLLLGWIGMAGELRVELLPVFDGKRLQPEAILYPRPDETKVSVTRLDLLLSEFALVTAEGASVPLPAQYAYISVTGSRTEFVLKDVPAGRFAGLEFRVGLPEAINHRDPAIQPPGHPLHPQVNGLHWNWQGGYVFLALEGLWSKSSGPLLGYSYHLATDRLQMPVRLRTVLRQARTPLRVDLDVGRILAGVNPGETDSSTHSREGDPLAVQLAGNVSGAFTVNESPATAAGVSPLERPAGFSQVTIKPSPTGIRDVAANATPYRWTISKWFPKPSLPLDNPLTSEGVELGRRLFSEPLLSANRRQSCASCHQEGAGFVDAGHRFSLGVEGKPGTRNAMPLLNLAWQPSFFWDGRASTLREQVLQPIQHSLEMHESLTNAVAKLQSAGYGEAFGRTFSDGTITADRIARALEQYLLTLVSFRSRFDLSLRGEIELTEQEKRGFELFHTEYDPRRGQFGADCFHCHGGPLFGDFAFRNNGLDPAGTHPDTGRHAITGRSNDLGRFKTPSLRNIALTAPYMHDGRFASLRQAIEHYRSGVHRSPTLDANLAKHPDRGIPLTDADVEALTAFLESLTESRPGLPR